VPSLVLGPMLRYVSRTEAVLWVETDERCAGVPRPAVRWRLESGPWFDNVIATLDLEGRNAVLHVEHTSAGSPRDPRLETLFRREL
jgi:hypothetical protein